MMTLLITCKQPEKSTEMNILYLHQSTGGIIWQGSEVSLLQKAAGKVNLRLKYSLAYKPKLPRLFKKYNKDNQVNYKIAQMLFPGKSANNPSNYYKIWVEKAGHEPYLQDPTLELLSDQYQIIIFKHCYTASHIEEATNATDINSNIKTISNYKLQYSALRDKLHSFPATKFILFVGAIEVRSEITEAEAKRANEFFQWVTEEWDLPGDNIYLWDLYSLQTEGGLYFKDEYAMSPEDSHPNKKFASRAVELLFNRIIDVIENNGNGTLLTGEDI